MFFGFALALTGMADLLMPSMEERVLEWWIGVPVVLVRMHGVVNIIVGIVFCVAALSPGRWPPKVA
jgi:hypothetical protein